MAAMAGLMRGGAGMQRFGAVAARMEPPSAWSGSRWDDDFP